LADEPVDLACRVQGHVVRARTLDLSGDWPGIERQLLEMVAERSGPRPETFQGRSGISL
jgi:hypothetical protein